MTEGPDYSTNDRAGRIMGYRETDGVILFWPAEQGYQCPACGPRPIDDPALQWSEYRSFLWCETCHRDYPSALCSPDLDRGTDVFLSSVQDAIIRASDPTAAAVDRIDFLRSHAIRLWSDITGRCPSRPREPALTDVLVGVYPTGATACHVLDRIATLASTNRDALRQLVAEHSPGSACYVESRDWLYREPEALLIADLVRDSAAKLRGRFAGSDFESVLVPMIAGMSDQRVAPSMHE